MKIWPIIISLILAAITHGSELHQYSFKKKNDFQAKINTLADQIFSTQNEINEFEKKLNEITGKISEVERKKKDLSEKIERYDQRMTKYQNLVKIKNKKYNFKLFSKERKMARCLAEVNYQNFRGCEVYINDLTEKDSELVDLYYFYERNLAIPSAVLESDLIKKNNEYVQLKREESRILKFAKDEKIASIAEAKIRINNYKLEIDLFRNFIHDYQEALSCSSSMTTINHETLKTALAGKIEGKLFDSLRDNQSEFGLGTCYAHYTKDAITSLLGQRYTPSFLDLAMVNATLVKKNNDLSGGNACKLIKAVQEKGICLAKDSLFENSISLSWPARERQLLWRQIVDLKAYENDIKSPLMKKLFKKSARLLDVLPKKQLINETALSSIFFPEWKIAESYYTYSKKMITTNLISLEEWKRAFSKWQYTFDLKILQNWEQEILTQCGENKTESGCLSLVQKIYDDYEIGLKTVFKSFSIDVSTESLMSEIVKTNMQQTFSSVKMTSIFTEMHLLLQIISDNTGLDLDLKDDFFAQAIEFISSISSLNFLTLKLGVNLKAILENLAGNDSSLLKIIAPDCMNDNNRVTLPSNIFCHEIKNELSATEFSEQAKIDFRYKVLRQLVGENRAVVGNVYDTGADLHINSIAGFRFNTEKKSCEFLIRDSNGASSNWVNEETIMEKNMYLVMIGLTE